MEIFQFFIANFLSSIVHFSGFYEDKQREKDTRIVDCLHDMKKGVMSFCFICYQTSILLAIFGQLYYDKKCISTLDR